MERRIRKPSRAKELEAAKPKPGWFVKVKAMGGLTYLKRVPKGTPGAVLLRPKKGEIALSGEKKIPTVGYEKKKE